MSVRTSGARRPAGVVPARERFEERVTRARTRPWRLAAWGVAVLVVLLGLGWLVGVSSVLAVRTVTVSGLADPRERSAAAAAADVPLGTPLARVDTAGAADRVRRIATVADVSVSRSWPSTVTIRVTRKVPVLAVRVPDGSIRLVDAQGQAFQSVTAVPRGVALVGSSTATPAPQGLRAAASVLALLPATLRSQVGAVTVTSADLVTFTLTTAAGPVAVTWGGVDDGPRKLAVLQVLLRTSPKSVDVSAPDTPTTT